MKALLFTVLFAIPFYTGAAELKTEKEKLSYSLGYQIAQSLKRDALDVDIEVLAAAMKAVLQDKKLALTPEEMQATVENFKKNAMEQRESTGKKNQVEGKKFLDENKKKKGVKITSSGLQYKVIKEGSGKSPGKNDAVTVHYRGKLIDGTEFDSSYVRGKPTSFQVKQVIAGWQEGLQLMNVGSQYQFYIPSDLAYGETGARGQIAPHATLVFDVELLEIKENPHNR